MVKTLAFTCLHYGKEYLEYSIKSVQNSVDNHLIIYTGVPSFDNETSLANPDSMEELKAISDSFEHTIWMEINRPTDDRKYRKENQHRQMAIDYGIKNNYDVLLVVDYDEVWNPEKVNEAIEHAYNGKAGQYLVAGSQWVTLWKDFNHYVTDGFAPVRLFNLRNNISVPETIQKGFIYHMGYCISDELMRYKISCHGHKADFQKNNTWFNEKWIGWNEDTMYLHPATKAYWDKAKPFDKNELPEILKVHPNFEKELI